MKFNFDLSRARKYKSSRRTLSKDERAYVEKLFIFFEEFKNSLSYEMLSLITSIRTQFEKDQRLSDGQLKVLYNMYLRTTNDDDYNDTETIEYDDDIPF